MSKSIWRAELRQDPKTNETSVSSIWRPVTANGLYLRIAAEAAPVDVRELLCLTTEHGSVLWDGDKPLKLDFRQLKRAAGTPHEFFKTFTYDRRRKKYDKDLVGYGTFEVNEPLAGFMHQRWESIIDLPSLDRQLSAGQHVAAEVMKQKFPAGLPANADYATRNRYDWVRTALGMPQRPTANEKPIEEWSYCDYCGNAKVPDRAYPCNACSTVLRHGLSIALEVYKTLCAERRQCCGGLSSDKSHLHFHGRDWECTYPEKGETGCTTTVEMGVALYGDHAQTYWIFDNDSTTDSHEYGDPIKYYDHEFWEKLDSQLNEAAEAAWNSDICSCEHCGDHYHVGYGPCGCSESREKDSDDDTCSG